MTSVYRVLYKRAYQLEKTKICYEKDARILFRT